MLIKTLTAFAMIAVVLPCVILGGPLLTVMLAAVAFLAAYETCSLTDQKPHWDMTIIVFAALACLYLFSTQYFTVICCVFLTVLFLIEIITQKIDSRSIAFIFLITMLMGLALDCFSRIYSYGNAVGFRMLMYVAIACFICDTMAYFTGVFFGKHKLIPRISPNKTWEGAIGGYCFGLAASMIFGLLFVKELPSVMVICGSFLLPAVAQLGDLSFSSIKRYFDIKDFGSLFPGHGGILDRIDSLIFCLMVFHALMIIWGI